MISRRTVLAAGTGAVALTGLRTTTGFAGTDPWSRLSSHLRGRLVRPADSGYTTARQLNLGQFDSVNPQGVAYCSDSTDVSTCLKFAQDHALPFSVRSGGHSNAGYSTSPGLVIDVTGLNTVAAGPSTATVGGGTTGFDAVSALAPLGLTVPTGFCPSVSVGGYYQGGGMGALTRYAGMACDRLVSARVVLADGRTVTASATENRHLYWAIRGGGGGNFGVITSYEIAHCAVSQIALIRITFGYDKTADMLDGYARWLVDSPRTVGSGSLVQLMDAAPGHTPVPVIHLLGFGTTAELTGEASRLTALTGTPLSQSPVAVLPYQAAMMALYGCTSATACHRADTTPGGTLPRQEFGLLRSRMFSAPPSHSMWERVAATFEIQRRAGHTRQLEVWAFDGAVHDTSPTATAFVHRDSLLSVSFLGTLSGPAATDPAERAATKAYTDQGFAVVDPESSGETYQNFVDAGLPDWQRSYYGQNYPRLSRVKHLYDPHGAFRFAQGIS